jgi:hypothetical protein
MTAQAQVEVNHAEENAKAWYASIIEMLQALNADTDEVDQKYEDAMQAIHESVLSVMVRDGWRNPYGDNTSLPEEYEILLTTGGPALRIHGGLDEYGQPCGAELQYQDWGTRWTRYPSPEADLLRFAQCFYFGE